jgi:hypothetical protein
MIVKENINFERGLDPKSSMKIGLPTKIKNGLWGLYHERGTGSINLMERFDRVWLRVEDYGTDSEIFRKNVYKNFGTEFFSDIDQRNNSLKKGGWTFHLVIKPEYHQIFKNAFTPDGLIKESLNFERGQNPREILKLGLPTKIKKGIWGLSSERGVSTINISGNRDCAWLDVTDYIDNEKLFLNYVKKNFGSDFFSDIEIKPIQKKLSRIKGRSWRTEHKLIIKSEYQQFFKNAFTPDGLIKESLNFERGQDPKDAMSIGRVEERKQKLIAEITEYDPESWSGSSVLSDYIRNALSPHHFGSRSWDLSTLEEASTEELRHALEYLKKWERIEKKQAEQRLKRYNNESLDFERGQEPKKAMNIGWGGFLIKNIQGLEHEGYTYDINNKEIAEIIRKNIPEINDNELSRFFADTLDDILDHISAIDFRKKDYKNITWYIKDQIASQSRYWMSIHSDSAMRQIMRNSGMNVNF